MQFNLLVFLAFFFLHSVKGYSQGNLGENFIPDNEFIGVFKQTGPGLDENPNGWNWRFPYGTKLTVNGGNHRNFEIITGHKYGSLLYFRQFIPEAAGWGAWRKILMETADGKLGLGVSSPSEKLEVNGAIRAKEIKITASGWADHVFDPGYPLMDLKSLKEFIDQNRHLPGMPTENEVKEKGVNLGEINIKLLEKVEELTLHLINQQYLLDSLQKRMQKLEER